ncbi:MAG: orotidine-5'-phosphate decarboxylase [Prevotellaceae bacterium]|jgi:orotidine-5'-phosphate decarboxylase|nr:orotidine-5'-phosphate decarboxylase [Prevotellaceae bacterium]
MTANEIFKQILQKRSFLCVGLDTDINKLPECLRTDADPVFAFNKAIIDATAAFAVAFKPNLAFYEANGEAGWLSLAKTVEYLRKNFPEIFLIADAKRGDIGNTSEKYAETFFKTMDFDAITLSPYMGRDTVAPFLTYRDKWCILLALTSNPSAADFQYIEDQNGVCLYQKVLSISQNWGENIMYVAGATKAEQLEKVRAAAPNHFLLVPGIGAQGGSLQDVARYGMNSRCGLLVSASRSILYADSSKNFAQTASQEAKKLQNEMDELLKTCLR